MHRLPVDLHLHQAQGAGVEAGLDAGPGAPAAVYIHLGHEGVQFDLTGAEQGRGFDRRGAGSVAGLPHIEGRLAGAGDKDAGHRHFHRPQLGVNFQQEPVRAHRQLHHLHQIRHVVGFHPGGQHHQVGRHFEGFAEGQGVGDFDFQGESVSRIGRQHFRGVFRLEAQEDHSVAAGLLVEFLLVPAIGSDVAVQLVDPGAGMRLADAVGGVEGRRAADPRAVLVQMAVFVFRVDAGDLTAAHAVNHGHGAHRAAVDGQHVSRGMRLGHLPDQIRQGDDGGKIAEAVFSLARPVGAKPGGQNDGAGFHDEIAGLVSAGAGRLHAGEGDVTRFCGGLDGGLPAAHGELEIADITLESHHFGVGEHRDVPVIQDAFHQLTHKVDGQVAGGSDAVESGQLAAQKGRFFDQGDRDAAIGQVAGRAEPGGPGADDGGVAQGRHPDRCQGFELPGFGGGRRHQNGGLVGGCLAVVDPAYLFADVGVLIDEGIGAGTLDGTAERFFMEARGAGGHHHPVHGAALQVFGDHFLARVGAHEHVGAGHRHAGHFFHAPADGFHVHMV